MATSETRFDLTAVHYDGLERPIASTDGIAVSAFRYPTGIDAIRLTNSVGEIVILPFHGQQIWDATFHGRRLTMRSVFDAPVKTEVYGRNYGAFLVHCGVLAIGNPAPEDTHPLHGEIPNATSQHAALVFGQDAQGAYVRYEGELRERVAFAANYTFTSAVTFRAGSSRLEMDLDVHNHRAAAMDLMYLAHLNFRPVDGARLVDTVADDPARFRVRRHLPIYRDGTPDYRALMDQFATDPAAHRQIVAGRPVAPELVAAMDCKADAEGWAHAMQLLPDGSADFISHRPSELPRAIRWLTRNGDEDALGLVLPATSEVDGKTAERKKGNIQTLAGGAHWRAHLRFGALTAAEAKALAGAIEAVRH